MARRSVSIFAATTFIVAAGWLGARKLGAFEPSTRAAADSTGAMSEIANRDTQIRVWKTALGQDPKSAIALGQLAALYNQRARETGDDHNYLEAESYARRSLALRTNRNGPTFVTLAAALVAQHRFGEAEGVAAQLVQLYPDIPQYRAQLGEIQMELGHYDAAGESFDSLYAFRTHLSIAPRIARWAELNGDGLYARKLLSDALDQAQSRSDIPKEQLTWFYLRLGDIDLRNGRHRSARSLFEKGLAIEPNDYRLLDAMAHLEAVDGNPRKSIDYGERGIAIKLDPATLGTIGDAYAALGDKSRAEEYYKAMEVAVSGQPGAYHRAWSLFLLDHNLRVSEVLENVEKEIQTRQDVYGYDLLAWALHKSHRDQEARAAITEARKLGTHDAMLFYHEGMIDRSLGDNSRARYFLTKALEVNSHFHPIQPDEARAVIDSIASEERSH